jgi:hypothetical protein
MKKGKRDHYSSFVALERRVLRSEEWRSLSLRGKLFYIHLKGKYNRINNGEIQLHFSELSGHPGFRSRRAFYGAAKELVGAGWVERTNPGGLYRNPNTYKLTGRFDAML